MRVGGFRSREEIYDAIFQVNRVIKQEERISLADIYAIFDALVEPYMRPLYENAFYTEFPGESNKILRDWDGYFITLPEL